MDPERGLGYGIHPSPEDATQLDLTPFQRQVFEAEFARQAREQEKRREEMRPGTASSGSGRTLNSRGSQTPESRSETVRYVNAQLNPDHDAVVEANLIPEDTED